MTKQLQILLAIKALIAAALPLAEVRGFDGDASKPGRIGDNGTVIGHPGDPGDPEIDLSPLTYHYQHRLYLELAAPEGAGGVTLDAMLEAIGAAVAADKFLGGLCEYFSAEAPDRNDRTTPTVATSNWATVPLVAEYSTENPLG